MQGPEIVSDGTRVEIYNLHTIFNAIDARALGQIILVGVYLFQYFFEIISPKMDDLDHFLVVLHLLPNIIMFCAQKYLTPS